MPDIEQEDVEQLEGDRQLRALQHAAETLARLGLLAEFEFLRGEVANKHTRMATSLAARVMSGEGLDVLQRQVDYDRGFIAGMLYPFEVVQGAQARLRELDESREASEPEEEKDVWSSFGAEE